MKVIAGVARGRKIKTPRGLATRPTLSRIKENMFNVLYEKVSGSIFLDIFAGSGSIGIEALSRGAKKVVFVEINKHVFQILQENIKNCNFNKQAILRKGDVFSVVPILKRNGFKFDIIFADPPYYDTPVKLLLKLFNENDLLNSQGILILQVFKETLLPPAAGKLRVWRENKYGNTKLVYYFWEGK